MHCRRTEGQSRRGFLRGLTLVGTSALLGVKRGLVAAEPPPETTKLRHTASQPGGICITPKYVAGALLQAEGFTDIQYVDEQSLSHRMKRLASGETDLELTFVGPFIARIDARAPIVIIAGGHIGCLELFGTERVRTIRDLKGKTMAVSGIGEPIMRFSPAS
jgi:NitT/TauT family transport system substrate-binding protein